MSDCPVIIFGAGASYDCLDFKAGNHPMHPEKRPPLANQMFESRFDVLLHELPTLSSIVGELRSRLMGGEYLEEILFDIYERGKNGSPHRAAATKEAIVYCIRLAKRISSYTNLGTNYGHFLSKLRDYTDQACIITFNYDLLLDNDFKGVFKINLSAQNHYTSQDFKLLKLHGSCNWGVDATAVNDEHFEVVADPTDSSVRSLMCLPLKKGKNFACPTSYIPIVQEALKKTSNLIMIGWRGEEDHFVPILKDSLKDKRVNFCVVTENRSSALRIRDRFGFIKSFGKDDEFVFGGGFSGFLQGGSTSSYNKILEKIKEH